MVDRRILLLGLLVAVTAPAPGRTITPADLAEAWRWRRFDREEGLPAGAISAIGYDRDGDYIYAASPRGIFRYMGFLWEPIAAAEPFDGPIEKIVDARGDIYAATRREVWMASGLEIRRILRVSRILLAAGPLGGVYAIDPVDRVHYVIEKDAASPIDPGSLPPEELLDYAVDDRRIHWLATREGPYRRDLREGLRWKLDGDLPGELRGRPCRKLFLLRRQSIPRTAMAAPAPPGSLSFELWAVFEGAGAGGVGTRSILARRGESGWTVSALDPGDQTVADLVVDGGGTYIAVGDKGSIQISPDGESWSPVPQPEFLPGALSGGIVDIHGYLWYRAGAAAVFRFDGASRRWERYWHGLGLPANNVLSLLEAADGKVWAGTETGVYAFPPGAPAEPVQWRKVGDVALRSITGLAEDRTGRIWISSSEDFPGTFFHEMGSWHRVEGAGGGPSVSSGPIRRIVADRSGDLWFLPSVPGRREGAVPSSGYRIFRYSPNPYTPSQFRPVEIPAGPATDLLLAGDRALWIATERGLLRLAGSGGDVRTYTDRNGLQSSRIRSIAEAADGAIWITYDEVSGVSRIRSDEVRTFDERDGLASPNARSIACSLSPGSAGVWVGTDRGILRFDGECWYSYAVASLSRQESEVWPLAIAGGRRTDGPIEGETVLVGVIGHGIYRLRLDDRRRPRINRIEFDRTPDGPVNFRWDGRDFKNETPPGELSYRTRIDGGPWSRFGPQRSVAISALPPGDHRFHVEMRDLDGNANRQEYSLDFKITGRAASFFSPVLLAALGGAGAALALAALAAALAWRSLRRWDPDRAAAEAGKLLRGFPGAAVIVDGAGKIAGLCGDRLEVLGFPGDAGSGARGFPAEVLPVLQGDGARAALRQALAGERASAAGVPVGSGRTADVTAIPLGSGGPGAPSPGALALVEETTAARRAREGRERARRLRALQDLAGRVAKELAPAGDDARAAIAEALRTFSAEEEVPGARRERLDPAALLEGLLGGEAGREPPLRIPAGVEASLRPGAGLWSVPGDPGAIRTALIEILRNALEALAEGGRLSVRLRNRRLEADEAENLPAGTYVEIEVADDGPGIPAADVPRVFDPFFSTKPRDRSRGLGLSIAYGIVRRHRGDIRISSAPGAGTTVTILLPAEV